MRPVKPWPVQMDRYTRGIDNARVDILLSPQFVKQATLLVKALVHHEVATNYWGESGSLPRPKDVEAFRRTYQSLVEGAIKQRQQMAPADWVRLVQLSLLKFMLLLVPQQIHALRAQLEDERDDVQSLHSGRRLEFHERLVTLAREENVIIYQVFQRLFKMMDKLETTNLRKLRKSLLGVSWPLPREALFNSLLHLPRLLSDIEVMHHYPLFLIEDDRKEVLIRLNGLLVDVFRDYLPTWTQALEQEKEEKSTGRFMDRLDQGGLPGFLNTEIVLRELLRENEYKTPQYSWLDDPDNLMLLLLDESSQNNTDAKSQDNAKNSKHWRQFNHALREELSQRVEKLGLLPRVVASYWTPKIYKELRGQMPARLIYDYLTGKTNKRKILRRLQSAQTDSDPGLATKSLDFAIGEIKQLTREKRRDFAIQMLRDFLMLRRDLKLAYKTYECMDGIRLLDDEEDINLSRANGLLYEFRMSDEQVQEQRIHSHVILKADLRGSTRITAELRAKNLNPATHFSQNFFNPINAFLDDFGAKKVFVEGDAVILSFMEQSGGDDRAMNVAHACGLGARILEVVARQNMINRRYGLPDLELGIGVAFCNEEPTFLYDGDKQIMISPAINLADRLSSCAKSLRDSILSQGRPFRVEVLMPMAGSDALAGAKTDVLRYNLNGIEMDVEAFNKLRTELVLHRFDVKVGGELERFHVGRYPDKNGRMHWLAVREAPVKVWAHDRIGEKWPENRSFFEVIVEPSLLTLIRSRLRSSSEQRTAPS